MPQFTLADTPENTDEAQVDDVTLYRGEPVELSEEQAQRLRDAGVVFEGEQSQQAPEQAPAQTEEPQPRRRAAHPEGQEA